MALITSADIENLIVQMMPQYFADGTTRGLYARRLIEQRGLSRTDGSQWKFTDSAPTASVTSEGDPLPAASRATQQDAILKSAYVRSVIQVTDETLDSINNGGLILDDYLEGQILQCIRSIESQVETMTVGGTTGLFQGLGVWALDTGSPAGISRSSYSGWQAYTNANGGTPRAFTEALMRSTLDTFLSTKQGRASAIFMSVAKATAFSAFTGGGMVPRTFSTNLSNMTNQGFGSALDVLQPIAMYDNVPVYRIPTMGDDKVWFLDLGPEAIHYEAAPAPVVSEKVRKDNGSDQWDVRYAINLVVPNPGKNCAALVDLS